MPNGASRFPFGPRGMKALYLVVPLAPLFGAILAGLFGRFTGRRGAHLVTIAAMIVSLAASFFVFQDVQAGHLFNGPVYTWITSGGYSFDIGFLIDPLTTLMMLVVTFVSLMVHIYTIGYMHDDPGYTRFFSYISLFTFSMLMLVMSNNFVQLFFGWEAVGLVSYLLIGFWYTRPTAVFASLKAFLVNRVGDLGFLLGIALILAYTGSLDYATVFGKAGDLAKHSIEIFPGAPWSLMTVICLLLFVGAMGKSAQFPLHVWLPDSMEGPTPISALIHAATMVTAGIFMVSRMSPLFELSTTALSVVLIIGSITAFFMGLLGIVNNDIKRVVAYSTLSQLGYMTVGLGASAYAASMFHLFTHAFFKALLFLAAGSVIIAMHHEQDMRRMGGLRRYMPITYWTALIGSLALCGIPPFAGFFSKDSLIEAVGLSHTPGASIAYVAVLSGVFITALYTFRMMFMTFHGRERFHDAAYDHGAHRAASDNAASHHDVSHHDVSHHDVSHHDVSHHGAASHADSRDAAASGAPATHAEPDTGHDHHVGPPHETGWVITVPLILLAVPSVYAGWAYIEPLLFGTYFGNAIYVAEPHNVLAHIAEEFHGVPAFVLHGLLTPTFWLAIAGIVAAWYLYLVKPDLPGKIANRFRTLYTLLSNKYYIDEFYQKAFTQGALRVGSLFWKVGDVAVIDGFFVNGAARVVAWSAAIIRRFQSGYVYHYAFMMLIGVFVLLTLWFARA